MSASSVKGIKNRIKSIESTMQITKAMELVASSKIRRVTDAADRAKPYFDILRETLDDIVSDNKDFTSAYTRVCQGNVCRVVIAGDRGLAGGYNSNLFKSFNVGTDDIIFPIGRKAAERFSGYRLYTTDYEKTSDVTISDCRDIGALLSEAYKNGEFASLCLHYTSFKNAILQEPAFMKLLPLSSGGERRAGCLTLYEPDAESVFDEIIPSYISGMLYGAVCESEASEISARRNAMETANKNAADMLENLRIEYNRARQGSITREITEIAAGAENL
ncbi:MAG: ATP synthase F1 subunit gamma [Firmicutes bacterium]|nr:ATP synthase F1 subunit gamma [Bacillota bacterium]